MGAEHCPVSSTKARLLKQLGLIEGNAQHEQLYLAIKADTDRAYTTLTANRANLKPENRNVQGRWPYNYVTEEAILRTIRQIETSATPRLKQWYVHWGVAEQERNFVIDWFLWHAFRNKDARNQRSPRSSTTDFHADDDDPSMKSVAASGSRYDPVRNGYVPTHRGA